MQFQVMFKKELLENWRNLKWIWVPIVFIIFSIMDPIVTYYIPRIMESVGGLPEGTVFSMPMPNPNEAILMSFSQLGTLGVLITVVISMGMISGELKSGVYELILSKPVSYINYVTSKFSAISLIVFISLIIGMVAGWYYVNLLFGDINLSQVLVSTVFFACYFIFLIAIVVFVNTLFNSPGLVAFISIIIIVAINTITGIYRHVLTWSPAAIDDHISVYLRTSEINTDFWFSAILSLILAAILLVGATYVLKNRALD